MCPHVFSSIIRPSEPSTRQRPDNGDGDGPETRYRRRRLAALRTRFSRERGVRPRRHERRFQREMQAAYERWQRGDVTAYSEAIRLLSRRHPFIPDWLVEASKVVVERAIPEGEKRARREWRIAWTRWEMVTELRQRGDELFHSRKAELERVRAALKVANDAQNTKEIGRAS